MDGLVDLNEKVNYVCLRGLLSSISQASPLYSFQCRNVHEESRVGLLESFPIPSDHRKTKAAPVCAFINLQNGVMSYTGELNDTLGNMSVVGILREGTKGVKYYL